MKVEETRFEASTVFEGMTSISAVINGYLNGSTDRKPVEILIDRERAKNKEKEIAFLKRNSEKFGYSLKYTDSEDISKLTTGNSHGGIIAVCSDRTIPSLSKDAISDNGFYVMIEGIEDPYNFGYAIRSIYASGANGIILSPRNWMSAAGVVCRSSAGASELIPLFVSEPEESAKFFKSKGYKIIGAGIRDSVSAFDADMKRPVFLIVGGEKRGISRTVLDLCDTIVRLEYGREFKGSLSAASAASILSYEVFRQNR